MSNLENFTLFKKKTQAEKKCCFKIVLLIAFNSSSDHLVQPHVIVLEALVMVHFKFPQAVKKKMPFFVYL